MSTDYSAVTILGVEVNPEKRQKRRGCNHKLLQKGQKYCVECGKPAFEDDDAPILWEDDLEPSGFDWVGAYDREREREVLIIGKKLADCDEGLYEKFMPQADTTILKNHLRKFLEPRGLWDGDKFGYWTVCRVS